MASVIFARDKSQVMSAFMALVIWVGTLSQHLSCASKVLKACASNT
jgi:hypothetical protein